MMAASMSVPRLMTKPRASSWRLTSANSFVDEKRRWAKGQSPAATAIAFLYAGRADWNLSEALIVIGLRHRFLLR